MSAEDVMEKIAAAQGWNDASQLALALQYISFQGDDSAFRDFLLQQADAENEYQPEDGDP